MATTKTRPCRVCGQPFRPARFDSVVCSDTCAKRKYRGGDLAYLATMPDYLADARRFLHEADLDAIATARAVAVSQREGRAERRGMPRAKRIRCAPTAL
jgi:DNA polymerase III epsilon subunit-like protein